MRPLLHLTNSCGQVINFGSIEVGSSFKVLDSLGNTGVFNIIWEIILVAGDAVTVDFDVEETDVAFENVSIDSDNFIVEVEGIAEVVEEVGGEVVVNVVLESDVFGREVILELNKLEVVVIV